MRSPLRRLGYTVSGTVGLAAAGLLLGALLPEAAAQIRFRDVAADAGVEFVLESRPTPRKLMIEAVAGGVAAFDADSDGLIDIFFTNGADGTLLRKQGERHWNRLFRNLGDLRFADITEDAGVAGRGYSMGAAAADYDNDGDADLFVAGVRANILLRNDGHGAFSDVTAEAGIASDHWSVAAGWFDYDRDGLLDLLVVNYLDWSPREERFCGDRDRGLRIYCSPTYFGGLPNSLHRNAGDGTFEDVSEASGIADHVGKGMSVAFADYDLDGWIDAFVTNDTEADFLFRNLGDGTFEEVGLLAGAGLASDGSPVSSMGVDFRDYDNDGLPDIHVTALHRQTFPLFRNVGGGQFEDATAMSGLHALTVARSGWANAFVDLDNDGLRDLFVATSHVNDLAEEFENTEYLQPNAVFRNTPDGGFRDASASAASFPRAAHRGAAFADFDGDGRVDVVASAIGSPAQLWRNTSPGENQWLAVRLQGETSNANGIGAIVRVGDQTAMATSAVGYASSSLVPVHFGLGTASNVSEIIVEWPAGARQRVIVSELNRVVTVREAGGGVR